MLHKTMKVLNNLNWLIRDTKRLWLAIISVAVLLPIFIRGDCERFKVIPALILFLILLASLGALFGHILGKGIFGKVDWQTAKIWNANAFGRILFYVLSIYLFTRLITLV